MKMILLVLFGFTSLFADLQRIDNSVVDTASKLVWQDNGDVEKKELLYDEAKQYCTVLNLDNRSTWRLPTVYELQSIVDLTQYDPALQRGFHFGLSKDYWSVTPYADDKDRAWFVDFKSGSVEHSRRSYDFYVRCVSDQ
jgi:hypothetical protein